MVLSTLTKPEIERLLEQCNFVNFEKPLFEMRANGMTLEQIAEILDISVDYARKISQKVNRKILKVF